MGKLAKGVPGEVFAAWFVQAMKWGFPAAGVYGAVMTVLIIRSDPTPAWDLGWFWLVVVGTGAAFAAAVPTMAVGGVAAGLAAIAVTKASLPVTDERHFSKRIRSLVGVATAVVLVVFAVSVLVERGADFGRDDLGGLIFWLGPLAIVVFAAVWFGGRRAVEKTLSFVPRSAS